MSNHPKITIKWQDLGESIPFKNHTVASMLVLHSFSQKHITLFLLTSHSFTNVPGPFWQVSNQVEVHEDFQRHLQGHGSFKTTLLQNKIDVENPPFLWETIGFPHLCLFTPGCIILKNIGNDCSILQDVTSIRLGANISKLER